MKNKTISIILLSALLISCNSNQQTQQETTYDTLTITPTNETISNSYSASIKGKSDIAVMPQISGYITKVYVQEGQRVQKNQKLFVIDQVPYIAAHQTAQANVSIAEANVQTARLTYNSKQELFKENVISEYDLQTTKNALTSAEAQLQLAKAQETNAANNLSYTVITSPSDGVIGTLPYKIGASVSPGTPLTTVSDNTEMYVYFSMTENQLLALIREHNSMELALNSMPPVKLELSDGTLFTEEGKIETISGIIEQRTGAVSLKAAFPNHSGLLHSGGSGKVIIPQLIENVYLIPKSATYEIQNKTYVYKVIDGKAISSLVEINPTSSREQYIVQKGLSVGDKIITEGVGFLRDGMTVNTNKIRT